MGGKSEERSEMGSVVRSEQSVVSKTYKGFVNMAENV